MDKQIDSHKKDWVVMIYMASDNDLGDESIWALTEIGKAKLGNKMGVAVLFDSGVQEVPTQVFKYGLGTPPPNFPEAINPLPKNTFNQTKKEKSASDPQELQRFIKETMAAHHAEHYMLILSGHGSGAVGDFLKGGANFTGMSIPSLSDAIKKATNEGKEGKEKYIDVLGMDSCLMSMVEVCFQLPSTVKYLVGSEGFDPTTGWPYQQILQKLAKETPLEPLQAAQTIVKEYIAYYTDYIIAGTSVDMALCDLSESKKNELNSAIKALGQELTNALENPEIRDEIILAHWKAQSYKRETYTDLWDFCDLLQDRFEQGIIYELCERVKEAIEDLTCNSALYYGPDFQHSHGLSIYFPWREFEEELGEYAKLDFAGKKEPGWGGFLKSYVDATQREKRGQKREGKKQEPLVPAGVKVEEISLTPTMGADVTMMIHKGGEFSNKYNNPPYKYNNPPYKMGVFARSASMKNPPNGFLVNCKNRKEAILPTKKTKK